MGYWIVRLRCGLGRKWSAWHDYGAERITWTTYHKSRDRSWRPREIRPDLHLVTSAVEPGAMAQDYGAERDKACAELHDYGAERGERGAWYDYGAERIMTLCLVRLRCGMNLQRGREVPPLLQDREHTTVIVVVTLAKSATPPLLLH